jgi:hypothetical protein
MAVSSAAWVPAPWSCAWSPPANAEADSVKQVAAMKWVANRRLFIMKNPYQEVENQ